ncbi:MAG: hypothetical protein K9I68_06725 [Bacteroidales bacterium]|nr:hypothetical protein [Bacteroidales bacterium]MCF8337307.1 hypothetical protein [Bacteroidales bacterium]
MMLLSKESFSQEKQNEDILLRFQRKEKKEEEITSNMQPEKIADIISDKLIRKIQEAFKAEYKEDK